MCNSPSLERNTIFYEMCTLAAREGDLVQLYQTNCIINDTKIMQIRASINEQIIYEGTCNYFDNTNLRERLFMPRSTL